MATRPNILVLMTDQQRQDALGCYGNPVVKTPHMDSIAAEGVRFTQACCPTPICVASRMSFITGHRAATTHWVANQALPGPLPELPTMMGLLLRAGYWTQGIGKMHFRGRHYGFRNLLTMEEGIAYWPDDDYMRYLRANKVPTRFPKGIRDLLYYQPQTSGIPREHSPITWVADRSIEFLREHTRHRGSDPFFLWSSWIAPHPPFAPCEPYDSLYDPADMSPPVLAERPLSSMPSTHWGHRFRLDGAHRDPDRINRIRALYYGQITHVDDEIGRVLAELEAQGLAENTAVLFTADHGDMLGDHGLSQKNCPYEPSIKVPLLLKWPGRTRPETVCDDLVGLTDVLPTILDELGIDYPSGQHQALPGASLLGAEGGGLAHAREAYVVDYDVDRRRWICGRTGKYKYVAYACDDGVEALYDLGEDPGETNNIIREMPDLGRALRGFVLEWERNHGMPGSFEKGLFKTYPRPERVPPEEEARGITLNDGPWPKRLPPEERDEVETFAEAFTRAISKETTLSPEKLSLGTYKRMVMKLGPEDPGGESLEGTPWEEAWREA